MPPGLFSDLIQSLTLRSSRVAEITSTILIKAGFFGRIQRLSEIGNMVLDHDGFMTRALWKNKHIRIGERDNSNMQNLKLTLL